MARWAGDAERKRVVNQLAKMLVTYLLEVTYKGCTPEEVAQRTGVSASIIGVPWYTDVPEICERANLDIGLAIRDSKGHEVTFWPLENLSQRPQLKKGAEKRRTPAGEPALHDGNPFRVKQGRKSSGGTPQAWQQVGVRVQQEDPLIVEAEYECSESVKEPKGPIPYAQDEE